MLVALAANGTVILFIAISAAFAAAVIATRTYPVVATAFAAVFAINKLVPRMNMFVRLGDKSAKHDEAKRDADYLGENFFTLVSSLHNYFH